MHDLSSGDRVMRLIKMLEKYKIAYATSDRVVNELHYNGGMVNTNEVASIVERLANTKSFKEIFNNSSLGTTSDNNGNKQVGRSKYLDNDIKCTNITQTETSFTEFQSSIEEINDFGAMMRVQYQRSGNLDSANADIVLNSDHNVLFKRFSYVHELGHLITGCFNFADESTYTLSIHINFDVFSLTDKQINDSLVLQHEQLANIFALRVLMPKDKFFEVVNSKENFSEVAEYFGVTKEAVISRLRLVE